MSQRDPPSKSGSAGNGGENGGENGGASGTPRGARKPPPLPVDKERHAQPANPPVAFTDDDEEEATQLYSLSFDRKGGVSGIGSQDPTPSPDALAGEPDTGVDDEPHPDEPAGDASAAPAPLDGVPQGNHDETRSYTSDALMALAKEQPLDYRAFKKLQEDEGPPSDGPTSPAVSLEKLMREEPEKDASSGETAPLEEESTGPVNKAPSPGPPAADGEAAGRQVSSEEEAEQAGEAAGTGTAAGDPETEPAETETQAETGAAISAAEDAQAQERDDGESDFALVTAGPQPGTREEANDRAAPSGAGRSLLVNLVLFLGGLGVGVGITLLILSAGTSGNADAPADTVVPPGDERPAGDEQAGGEASGGAQAADETGNAKTGGQAGGASGGETTVDESGDEPAAEAAGGEVPGAEQAGGETGSVEAGDEAGTEQAGGERTGDEAGNENSGDEAGDGAGDEATEDEAGSGTGTQKTGDESTSAETGSGQAGAEIGNGVAAGETGGGKTTEEQAEAVPSTPAKTVAIFVQEYPKDPVLRLELARLLDEEGKTREAVRQAERAVRLDRRRADAWRLLARLYHKQGRRRKARRARRKYVRLRRRRRR